MERRPPARTIFGFTAGRHNLSRLAVATTAHRSGIQSWAVRDWMAKRGLAVSRRLRLIVDRRGEDLFGLAGAVEVL
jgi:hypothetical protein